MLIWLAVVVGVIFLFNMFSSQQGHNSTKINYSLFLNEVEKGNITDVRIMGP